MLAAARTHAPLVRADGAALPFPDGAIDGVTCGFALRNFVDLSDRLPPSARRVLRPGGPVRGGSTPPCPRTRSCAPVNGFGSGGVVPARSVACSRTIGDAYRYLPKSTAYLPAARLLSTAAHACADFYDHAGRHVHRRIGAPAHRDARVTQPHRRGHGCHRGHGAKRSRPRPARRTSLPSGFRLARTHDPARRHRRRRGASRADDVARRARRHRHRRPARASRHRRARGRRAALRPVRPRRAGDPGPGGGGDPTAGPGSPRSEPREPSSQPPPRRPSRFTVVAVDRSRAEWDAAVEAALAAIDAGGDFAKVVLAREVAHRGRLPFDLIDGSAGSRPPARLLRLRRPTASSVRAPSSSCAAPAPSSSSRPVAGTTVADNDARSRRSRARPRTTASTGFVVDAIVAALGAVCHRPPRRQGARRRAFGPVAHLATPIRGRAHRPRAERTRARARLLHPTPAVGGTPARRRARRDPDARRLRPRALRRARSAGSTPAATANGRSRSAAPRSTAPGPGWSPARASSPARDPAAEWAETQAKLEPMLRALLRP